MRFCNENFKDRSHVAMEIYEQTSYQAGVKKPSDNILLQAKSAARETRKLSSGLDLSVFNNIFCECHPETLSAKLENSSTCSM